jgi:hypothetical protein
MTTRALFSTFIRRTPSPSAVFTPPMLPLPTINGQPPVLLVFDYTEMAVDLAYERQFAPGGPLVRGATRDSTHYWVPRLTPVFTVTDGSIVYARKHASGDHTIIVDHQNDWLTVYAGLEHMFVPHSDRMPRYETPLKCGDMLGYVGSNKPNVVKPLHFELWKRNRQHAYDQVDPLRFMRRWRQVDWSDARLERQLGPSHTGS